MKKTITPKDKAKAALEALTEADTLARIASRYGAHPIQIGRWRKTAKENLHTLFDSTHSEQKKIAALEAQVDELHRLIGTRDEELAWLKKKSAA